jgi:hypothetical protein
MAAPKGKTSMIMELMVEGGCGGMKVERRDGKQ